MKDRIIYWREISDYDLETAEALLETKRYLYGGFMCHQAIEKVFKAYYVQRKSSDPPFSHRLSYIAKKGEFYFDFSEEQQYFIDQLEPLNIESRYPSQEERLMKSLTSQKCEDLLLETKKLHQWIKLKF